MSVKVLNNYEDALKYLLGLTGRGIQPGLSRSRAALRRLGNPHQGLPALIVGGTNGKGSVAAMVANSARHQGLHVGLFTSPHLHRLTERIQLDGKEITRRGLVNALGRVVDVVERPRGPRLTFFETLTVTAATVFAEEKVDLAVFEVGMGGRLDATRIMPAKGVVITGIALDHEQHLGRTLEAIAKEKFALVSRGAFVVAGSLPPDLAWQLQKTAKSTKAPLALAGRDFFWRMRDDGRVDYAGPGGERHRLRVALKGRHQAHNAAVSIAAMHELREQGIRLSREAQRKGLADVKWPGRLEFAKGASILFDVAHNPTAVGALCGYLDQHVEEGKPLMVVLGCMRDKDVAGIVHPLRERAAEVFLAAPKMARALTPKEFPPWVRGRPADSVADAMDRAIKKAGSKGLVVATGSSFVVAEARAHVLGLRRLDPSVGM